MAEIPSEVRSSEKEQAPQCGVATIGDADICRRQKRPGVLSCAVRGVRNAWKTVQWTVFSEERAEAPGTRNSARGARANPYRNEHRVRSKDERRRLRVRTHNCPLFIVNCSFVIAKRRHCPLLRPKDESFCILHLGFAHCLLRRSKPSTYPEHILQRDNPNSAF